MVNPMPIGVSAAHEMRSSRVAENQPGTVQPQASSSRMADDLTNVRQGHNFLSLPMEIKTRIYEYAVSDRRAAFSLRLATSESTAICDRAIQRHKQYLQVQRERWQALKEALPLMNMPIQDDDGPDLITRLGREVFGGEVSLETRETLGQGVNWRLFRDVLDGMPTEWFRQVLPLDLVIGHIRASGAAANEGYHVPFNFRSVDVKARLTREALLRRWHGSEQEIQQRLAATEPLMRHEACATSTGVQLMAQMVEDVDTFTQGHLDILSAHLPYLWLGAYSTQFHSQLLRALLAPEIYPDRRAAILSAYTPLIQWDPINVDASPELSMALTLARTDASTQRVLSILDRKWFDKSRSGRGWMAYTPQSTRWCQDDSPYGGIATHVHANQRFLHLLLSDEFSDTAVNKVLTRVINPNSNLVSIRDVYDALSKGTSNRWKQEHPRATL